MSIQVWGATDIGLKRDNNQDSILIDNELGVFIVADGMGGHKGGEVASALACEVVRDLFGEKKPLLNEIYTPIDFLREAYVAATKTVFLEGREVRPELSGMGTTLVVAICHENMIYFGNVGDSRAYYFNNKYLWQVTEDHSLVYEQMKLGKFKTVSENELFGKNIITRSVGFEPTVDVDIYRKELVSGDQFFMCSDGVTGPVTDQALLDIFLNSDSSQVPNACVKAANDGGGDDNISAIYIHYT